MNILAAPPTTQFKLLGAQYFKMNNPQPSRFLLRQQQVWVLELIMKGRLEVSMKDSDWIALREDTGIMYAPGTHYREKVAASGTICHSAVLFFDVEDLPASAPWDRFQEPYFEIRDEEKLLLPLTENSLHHLGLGVPDDVQATAFFLSIIAHLLRAEKRENTLNITSAHPGGDIVTFAHQYMRKRLGNSLQLAEIAAAVGMSVSGFAHNYKRQTGISPMTMLRRMRVETVKSHLLRERLTLEQIAIETGFADAFHLSRTFKNITGLSPRQFRRNAGTRLPDAEKYLPHSR